MDKSIAVSERTHASLFLLQAKLQVSDKKRYSMDRIIHNLLAGYDKLMISGTPLESFKLENIET